jgi:hypothetical protein
LRIGGDEYQAFLLTTPGTSAVYLPDGCTEIRQMSIGTLPLQYLPPGPIPQTTGTPRYYSILGVGTGEPGIRIARLDPQPDAEYELTVNYYAAWPALSAQNPTNILLRVHPDAYLFGSLAEAELFIGHDERAPLWLQRREAIFASIEQADRKARWPGALQVRVDGITIVQPVGGGSGGSAAAAPAPAPLPGGSDATVTVGGGSGGSALAPTPTPTPAPSGTAFRAVTPASGTTVVMLPGEPGLYIEGGPLAVLTIRLPPQPATDMLVEISLQNPVTSLAVQDSGGAAVVDGPTSAYGPGAGLQFRFIDNAWRYWK